ncbi:uncharacterized protein K452DRAFT_270038 [Aplosporella prunicola CBS 121167]|uniref:DUF647-domain-containing protein n=1 Tax=Aplosporella prunicola CBS 121167 TaxID=1176127 RepID=A0A6A6BDZ9_9PEZI|nr:uncharacterized protein K452DRAFT_270038 [Aplosporella prunicola CBS 121167]KAF2142402.1 hypothetical protein K452DRAFT_270038 [Aplosporella prunicola CBS 121167]
MPSAQLEIVEYDEAGNVTATYIESDKRVDVVLPESRKTRLEQLLDVFLPAGYPQSVTEDYLEYQIYDSLQAFSSSIAGLLSSRAVLEGVGVGDASASPTAALLLNVLQESMGRIVTILFAHKLGTSLEPECKMYRLAADVFNDTAMLLDCVSPVFPRPARVLVLSFASVLRALCGVAAGSSKASLSAHFAKQQNLGELNAKDSSQETIISLMGMLAGSVVVSWVSSPLATWLTMLLLLSVHLGTNYAAVRAVSMRSLNRQRANIVMSHAIVHDKILTPQQVSQRERVFERDGVLRWTDDQIIGRCKIGVKLQDIVGRLGPSHERTRAVQTDSTRLSALFKVYQHESYILWFDMARSEALIALKHGCTPVTQLQAWTQALLLASRCKTGAADAHQQHPTQSERLRQTLERARQILDAAQTKRLEAAGWDLGIGALETHSGTRAAVLGPERSAA